MNPEINSHVKILLRNAATVEGIVQVWNDNFIKLSSIDEKSYIILYNPRQDILLVKVFVAPLKNNKITEIKKEELVQKFENVYQERSDDPLRTKKLADLRILMTEHDRQIIASKLKQHHIQEVAPVNYEQPSFFKK